MLLYFLSILCSKGSNLGCESVVIVSCSEDLDMACGDEVKVVKAFLTKQQVKSLFSVLAVRIESLTV